MTTWNQRKSIDWISLLFSYI